MTEFEYPPMTENGQGDPGLRALRTYLFRLADALNETARRLEGRISLLSGGSERLTELPDLPEGIASGSFFRSGDAFLLVSGTRLFVGTALDGRIVWNEKT